ncbi:MAG: hypothetical protein ACPGWR_13730 [Ardenticatenaceae bacterium]
MDGLLQVIANPKTDKESLMQAIQQLGSVSEPAQFWSDMANSESYSQDHRRRAVFQLFLRHVSPGISLAELAQILANPSWLADDEIHVVTFLAGKIPVKVRFEDTIFVLCLFPDLPDGRWKYWAIYLSVSGKVKAESLRKVLRGDAVAASRAKMVEFGLSPDDPTNVDW